GEGQPTAAVSDLHEAWAAAAMRSISAALGVGTGDEERVGPAHQRRLAGIERRALAMHRRGRSVELPGRKPTLDVLSAVAERLRHGQQNPVASTLSCAVEADSLPGAELDRQHADRGMWPLECAFQRVFGG